MHREISHADQPFQEERNLSLYLLTGLIGLLIAADLWPSLVAWLGLPAGYAPWPRLIAGKYPLSLLAAVIGGARILYGSIASLLEGKLGADLALAIACIAAILINEPLVAAEVVFIGMFGECLESFTFERTQRAIRSIVEVCPRRCWLLRDGQEVRVLTGEVQVGDRVVVKPGARVPVDGVVLDGRSAVDASALTGESIPVDKGPGDEVLAGSLNQFGALTVEAQRVQQQTVVGRVIELTARALQDKAPLERTADRLARYFLPVVLGLAALTFLVCLLAYWGPLARQRLDLGPAVRLAVYPTLAVLVVACPCALILATPAAVIAALGRLAGTGILIKGGSAIERLSQVRAFAFDKTGTLTEGKLELGDVLPMPGVAADEVLKVAATAEQNSEHPIARAILQAARAKSLALDAVAEFQAQPGAGVAARTVGDAGLRLLVGTPRLLEERQVPIPAAALELLTRLDSSGQTALLVALDDLVLGAIGARDRVRPEAADVLTQLRNLGVERITLLTGDRSAAAKTVATAVGIDEVHAGLLPPQKADFVASQAAAFVGDGINDAPALARAQVGLAIGGTGTDVAAEAGDIVLMGDPLRSLPLLLKLSRETVRIIRQNILIFAFIINGIGIVVTGWLWPLFAPADWYDQAPLAGVIYHQLGSLLVLLNAMRLLWFERGPVQNPTWTRLRDRMQQIDAWSARHLNLDEGLHWIAHHARGVTAFVFGLVVAGWLLSGFIQVNADEAAVASTFGRPEDDTLEPGLHWRWPWPVTGIARVQPDRVRTVEIGFRSAGTVNADLGWSSQHRGDGLSRIGDEAVMITGDGNLIELQATVRYTVERKYLHTFLFGVRDPDAAVRGAAEAVLREAVASQPFLDLLTVNRERFQEQVLARLRQRWQSPEYGAAGLGIRLDGLSLHDLHPPQEVVEAYHAVAKAMEQRDLKVNLAQAEAIRLRREAEADELRTVREAEATAEKKVREAETARDGFLARWRARSELPAGEEWRLLSEAAMSISQGQDADAAYRAYQQRRQEQLATQAYLTDFRLSLRMLGDSLKGRDKVIVDSPKVPGRRHLMLFDPDWFKAPAPIMLPPDRGMPERSRLKDHEN